MRLTTPLLLICLALVSAGVRGQPESTAEIEPVAIAIHGGAGTISRESLTAERERTIREALEEAIRAGHAVLEKDGAAVDAVTAAITVLEDAPEFNAGRGAVLTSEGQVEMDASLMTGHDLGAGAVASVQGIRHPILAARAVLEHSPHVMLVGAGAEEFARARDLKFMPGEWFETEFRREQLREIKSRESGQATRLESEHRWFSTVGAVALDRAGDIAAGTSTGGMSNKRFGRVGDSPIIGAGTYADNRSCAVSATGHGEYFIRHVVAYSICERMRLAGETLAESADFVINDLLVEAGGDGGVIALDANGNLATPFNTPGMYRATIDRDGNVGVKIYRDE
ncbi:MAG: isoaspartyl peptidase/L-asparaginase [Wenzhouxiangellaceae bacterium]|nr:isoaspartyl peptidase/L-asparaginase [Wenzhouxiangellaceae bacterium]